MFLAKVHDVRSPSPWWFIPLNTSSPGPQTVQSIGAPDEGTVETRNPTFIDIQFMDDVLFCFQMSGSRSSLIGQPRQ